MMSLRRLFRSDPDPREARRPLWQAVVATARAPHWYRVGDVPDTLDGRFDMVCLVLALVLHRIDDDPVQALAGVQLTELFVADMDGQIRDRKSTRMNSSHYCESRMTSSACKKKKKIDK